MTRSTRPCRYAPAALNNLYLAGNVKQGTLDTRDVAGELLAQLQDNPAAVLCTLVGQADGSGACDKITERPASCPAPAPFGEAATVRAARGRADRPHHGRTAGGDAMRARCAPLRRRTASLLAGACWPACWCSPAARSTTCRSPVAPTPARTRCKVTLMFRDVLDLVPQSTVKVDDVTVGKVTVDQAQGLRRQGHGRAAARRRAARQRHRADPADQPARREVHRPRPAAEPEQRQARRTAT